MFNLNDLEYKCPTCKGYGVVGVPGGSEDAETCGECEGRGRMLTDQGQAVIDFVRRWLDKEEA